MGTISKKHRDNVMRCIIDFYSASDDSSFIGPEYIKFHNVLPSDINAAQVAEVLQSMGYVTVTKTDSGVTAIRLTKAGRCYFENQSDKKAAVRREYRHDWLIAVFTALAGALLSKPLWSLIDAVIAHFSG